MKKSNKDSIEYIHELEDKIVDLSLKLKRKKNTLKVVKKENHKRIQKLVHNLKNPIGVAYSFSEMILENSETISKEKLEKYIDVIHKSTDFSVELLNSIAVINRLSSPNFKLAFQKTNYCVFLTTVVNNFRNEVDDKNLVITTNFSSKEIDITFDINEMALVIKNVLSNAYRYSSENKTINITVIEKENTVETTITDKGVGISGSDLPHIFNEFYVVNTYCEHQHKCIGLGLAIVKLILNEHNGTIEANSTLESGSSFNISLPKN